MYDIQNLNWNLLCNLLSVLDDLEHSPDLKCVFELGRVLDNMNSFLILNILFKKFPIRSFTNRSNILRTFSVRLFFFSERWDCSWSFRLFLWKNNRSPGISTKRLREISQNVLREISQNVLREISQNVLREIS